MTAPTRWTASFEVRWEPMLTYGLRRLHLLEWFDANLDVVEFHESGHIGVAVGTPATRLTVSDTNLRLLLRSRTAGSADLEKAVAGVLEVLQPTAARTGEYRAAWSQELDADYDAACRRFASRMTGDLGWVASEAVDCAALTDIRIPSGHAQVDWGVVSSDELTARLMRQMTRTGDTNPFPKAFESDLRELPATSVFADVLWHAHPEQREYIRGASDVSRVLATVEAEIEGLVTALQTAV